MYPPIILQKILSNTWSHWQWNNYTYTILHGVSQCARFRLKLDGLGALSLSSNDTVGGPSSFLVTAKLLELWLGPASTLDPLDVAIHMFTSESRDM